MGCAAMLAGKVNVPACITLMNGGRCSIRTLFGQTIREILVDNGAKILHEHTRNDPALAGLDHQALIKKVWQRGRDLLPKVVSEQFLTQLTEQLECAHAEGVIGISLTWETL